jgi:glutamate dehydrogenase/leucine dehydrogenase
MTFKVLLTLWTHLNNCTSPLIKFSCGLSRLRTKTKTLFYFFLNADDRKKSTLNLPFFFSFYNYKMDVTKKFDVFISGAGPVGLFFAYQMAKRGHSIYICDFKAGPTLESRAASVTARTMEIFEARGLAGDFIAESFAAKGIKVWRNGKMVSFYIVGEA